MSWRRFLCFPLGLAPPLFLCPHWLGRPWMMIHTKFEIKGGIDYSHRSACERRFGMIIRTSLFFRVVLLHDCAPTTKTKNICVMLHSASHDSFVWPRLELCCWLSATWRYLRPIRTIRLNFGTNSLDRTLHLEAAG